MAVHGPASRRKLPSEHDAAEAGTIVGRSSSGIASSITVAPVADAFGLPRGRRTAPAETACRLVAALALHSQRASSVTLDPKPVEESGLADPPRRRHKKV